MVGSRLVPLSPVLPARTALWPVVVPHARIPSLSLSRERCIIIDDPATGVGTLINKSFEATIICIVHPPRRKGDLQGQQVGATGKGPSVFGAHVLEPGTGIFCRSEMETS